MAKFGRYDSSNKKRNQHKSKARGEGSFKRIKESDKGSSRGGFKVFLKTSIKNLSADQD